ncbi:oligosaccharide flippase family protein [Photorhabdus tasmaniensis]|uniref:oligosaccharide flippase family protein n=1 Tax=Photorhabdus tasmaniensis TaxID=1004159 RepID=UPI004041CC4C
MYYILSVSLRALTLFSKFLLVILLAKLLSISDLGIYGLISAVIGYTIFIVGSEFYTYSTREMITQPKSEWLGMIRDQFIYYLIVYGVSIPFILIMFYSEVLPYQYIWWFCSILLFEHIAQEINRILISAQSQLLASFVLFIRQGLWCWIVIVVMWYFPDFRHLETVFLMWLIGSLTACTVGGVYIFRYDRISIYKNINWAWIRKGVMLALPMLIASVAVRGVFTFDRFFIEKIAGLELLGAYVLFASMASAVQSFLDTIVITFSFPRLTSLALAGRMDEFKKEMWVFSLKVVGCTLLLSFSCWLFSSVLLQWLSDEVYLKHINLLGALLFATIVYCFSLIPHMGLYALRYDKHIIYSQVVALIIFVLLSLVAVQMKDVMFVLLSMIISFICLFVWKGFFYYRTMKLING